MACEFRRTTPAILRSRSILRVSCNARTRFQPPAVLQSVARNSHRAIKRAFAWRRFAIRTGGVAEKGGRLGRVGQVFNQAIRSLRRIFPVFLQSTSVCNFVGLCRTQLFPAYRSAGTSNFFFPMVSCARRLTARYKNF